MSLQSEHEEFLKNNPIPAKQTEFVPADRYDPNMNAVLLFFKGTNLDINMENTLAFENAGEQYDWFMAHKFREAGGRMISLYNGYVDVPFETGELTSCDYMAFQLNLSPTVDPDTGGHNQLYYCFITDSTQVIAKNTTRVRFRIDPIQTYLFRMKWKPTLVERINIPKKDSSVKSPLINLTDEKLYAGPDFETVDVETVDTKGSSVDATKKIYCFACSVNLDYFFTKGFSGSIKELKNTGCILSGVPVPFDIYVMPISDTVGTDSAISRVQKLFANDPRFAGKVITSFQADLITGIVNEGNVLEFTSDVDYKKLDSRNWFPSSIYKIKHAVARRQKAGTSFNALQIAEQAGITEPKLLMPDFYRIIVTDFQGDQQIVYPALFKDMTDISFTDLSPLGLGQKYGVYPNNYLGESITTFNQQYGVVNANNNEIPTETDSLAKYLQANQSQMAQQKIINNTNAQRAQASAVISGASSIGQGTGDVVSGIGRMGGTSPGAGLAGAGQIIGGGTTIATGFANGVNDYLYAENNRKNQNNLIDARASDASSMPAAVGTMGGNPYFVNALGLGGFYLLFQLPPKDYINKLTAYMNAYGSKQQNIMDIREIIYNGGNKHTYVKTMTDPIQGSFNTEARGIINTQFKKGLCFWNKDIGIGDISQKN